MNNKNGTKTAFLSENAHIFATFLIIIQPILDIISFWMSELGFSNSLTLALRLALFAVAVLYAFIISDSKKVYFILCGIMAAIFAGHIFACMQVGYSSAFGDITNYIRVVQMPVLAICMITFTKKNDRAFDGIMTGVTVTLYLTVAVMLISTVTGTDPHTYSIDKCGILGWFNNTNSQSSNLSVLFPLSLGWLISKKKRNPFLIILTAVIGSLALFFFGTRLAYFGLIAATLGMAVVVLIKNRSLWKYAVCFVMLFALAIGFFYQTPMYRHRTNAQKDVELEQTLINEKMEAIDSTNGFLDGKAETDDENAFLTEGDKANLNGELEELYRIYAADFLDILGLEKTAELFNYTTDINELSNVRAKKIMFAEMLMQASPVSARIFGLELSRFTTDKAIYDVENDFHGIYYLYGIVGLAVYLGFIAYFVYLIIWALFKNAKKYFTLLSGSFGIALVTVVMHSYFTAGVLRRPNASIFFSVILAGIYYLVRVRKYPEAENKEAVALSDKKQA